MNSDRFSQLIAHVARQGRVEWVDAVSEGGCLAGLSSISLAAVVRKILQPGAEIVLVDKSAPSATNVSPPCDGLLLA